MTIGLCLSPPLTTLYSIAMHTHPVCPLIDIYVLFLLWFVCVGVGAGWQGCCRDGLQCGRRAADRRLALLLVAHAVACGAAGVHCPCSCCALPSTLLPLLLLGLRVRRPSLCFPALPGFSCCFPPKSVQFVRVCVLPFRRRCTRPRAIQSRLSGSRSVACPLPVLGW